MLVLVRMRPVYSGLVRWTLNAAKVRLEVRMLCLSKGGSVFLAFRKQAHRSLGRVDRTPTARFLLIDSSMSAKINTDVWKYTLLPINISILSLPPLQLYIVGQSIGQLLLPGGLFRIMSSYLLRCLTLQPLQITVVSHITYFLSE